MAPAMICSSTFPPSPSPPDTVRRLQDPSALRDPHKPDILSEPYLLLTFLRAHARKQPCSRVKHYQTEIQGLTIGSSRLAGMIIFHKINMARSERQPLKTFCSGVPLLQAALLPPAAAVFLHPSPLGSPRFRTPVPKPEGNPGPAGRITHSPVIHPQGLCLCSHLQPWCNPCTRVQRQHSHPGLDGIEPAAGTRTPGQAALPGGGEGARSLPSGYSLLLDALILATSFCTPGTSPFFTAWINSCSRPMADRWERRGHRRQRPSDPGGL